MKPADALLEHQIEAIVDWAAKFSLSEVDNPVDRLLVILNNAAGLENPLGAANFERTERVQPRDHRSQT